MTKSELARALASKLGIPLPKAEAAVDAMFGAMFDALVRGERVEIRGLARFEVRHYKAYTGVNPRTSERVEIAAKRMPFFKAGKDLLERLNRKRVDE